MLLYFASHPIVLLAENMSDVTSTQPSWAGGFTTMLGWVAWFALSVCVLGVMISGGAMALASRRGEGGEHATRLGWVLAGCILIGSASAVVGGVLQTQG